MKDARALLAEIEAGTAPAILDVRSRMEFAHGHVPGALHIPFWTLAARTSEIPVSPDDPGHMSGWTRAGLRQEVVP
ncbi:MAG: hypothetical protein DMF94_01260 [Acidobacteria bacterium]|nr:MAG: hypothetical protein DMF94_01260 [Acidobacteriota bacterium]